ncbi:MAG: hypothetical protein Q8Q60_03385 [Candidatus Chromulinivorax sp.]|nr:hypothetical protein [Candidatus Chromulinivorax sp.]
MKKSYVMLTMIILMIPLDIMCFSVQKSYNQTKKSVISAGNSALDALKDVIDEITDVYAAIKKAIRKKYPYKPKWTDDQLQVRQGTGLCPRELKFIANRTPRVTQALKKNFDIDEPLKIGMCFSGGGNRAMLVSLGFLLGCQDIGLYDASYYMAGLSGSTWTLTPFCYLHATKNMSLTEFKDQLVSRIDNVMKGNPPIPIFTKYQNRSMQNNFAKRFGYGQYLSSIDIYGSFIGDFTLLPAGNNRLDVTWSSTADKMELGDIPLPMGSAVADKQIGTDDYYWLEVGPFEVGSDQLNAYVPTQAFGSKFRSGRPAKGYAGHAPEYPMSFYEGVFGSAYTASMNEADRLPIKKYKIDIFGQSITIDLAHWFADLDDNKKFSNNVVDNIRLFPACFHNYTSELKDTPIKKETKLKLYDGGLNFDLPLPLVMRQARDLDFIVACDAMIDLNTLQLAAIHFKRNNIKFPDVSNFTIETISKPLTVLNDPRMPNYDKDMVTIAYCPFIKNEGFSKDFDPIECREKGFCKMLNFNYTKEQTDQVVGVTRYNVNFIKDEIKAVLQALQAQKQANKPAAAPVAVIPAVVPAVAQVTTVQPAANMTTVATK